MIVVRRAPAYATVQDDGRRGFMSSGVPRCGAMDLPALRTLNALLGNSDDAAAIEWALSGGEVEITGRTTFALGGAKAVAMLNGVKIESYRATRASPGDVITIEAIDGARFLYVAFAGGIDVPVLMRSRSTYVPGVFGGLDGRRLRNADRLDLLSQGGRKHHVTDPLPEAIRPRLSRERIRFIPRDASTVLAGEWTISPASDRTGYRLLGNFLEGGASITSEPVCPGVIQLPPGGEPIVLMSDAPTVGGYRVLGAIATSDLGVFAQLTPGSHVEFEPVSVDAAQRDVSRDVARVEKVREWSLS